LAVEPIDAEAFALEVERLYACLISCSAALQRDPPVSILRPGANVVESVSSQVCEANLAGRLFYAGELDTGARALVVAANIAGAATLSASAEAEAGKQAMRDGVVDFLVNSLDEALRILKNEVRKRETVAVCVAESPEAIEREMCKRGVLPDLMHPLVGVAIRENQCILAWRVASAPALWLPKIDGIVSDCLHEKMGASGLAFETGKTALRWLRMAPRYLGRMAQGVRVLRSHESTTEALLQCVRKAVECGEIGVSVEVKCIGSKAAERNVFAAAYS